MNVDTYAGLSVARYVAMRNLDTSETERIIKQVEQKEERLFERASRVMSRVSFVDEIRYTIQLDLTDQIECMERNALETYLLCSCLDTLASKDDYVDTQSWLKARDLSICGISEREKLINQAGAGQQALTNGVFSSVLSESLKIYNKHYGVNKSIKNVIDELPINVREELASAYTIYKKSDSGGEEEWRQKHIDDKLKIIFLDYLFQYRRNLYTHEIEWFESFGGVSAIRESLRKGITELSPASTIHFPYKKDKAYVVTCHYGDEAEFLREVLITCLANKFNVLHSGWSNTYRKAEKSKRLLYALLYELKHNIQILQLHLQVLSELLIYRSGDGSPKLETKVAQSMLGNNMGNTLPIDDYLLHSYIEAASQFNTEIDKTGANTKLHMEDTSQSANDLIMKSKVRLYGQELGKRCMQLLNDYPIWTY
jgi:hypothetical protein